MKIFWLVWIASTVHAQLATNQDLHSITIAHARFSVLSESLLRLEWSPGKTFEDRASLVFSDRAKATGAEFNHSGSESGLFTLWTASLHLQFNPDLCDAGFTAACLKVPPSLF